ncbi:tetratricopeptide repeat protein [Nitrospina watsonii]|uniref:TPR_REGION domain-containing protein n=1 Tax=Nitrospina watsonii TaxID=1323948 RepID=A0ABN8VZ22_9BACT|nr:tetratricopeptide repeat protein [Nitrospina watsonii]CAI2718553.1 TPR_REGION domain-containing protein [Nitrospina watsonii]
MSRLLMMMRSLLMVCLCAAMLPVSVNAQAPHMEWDRLAPLQKGEIYLLRKKPAQALEIFRNLWRQEPHNHYAVRGIVRAYQVAGQLDESQTFFQNFVNENPEAAPAWYGLGYTYYQLEKYQEAKQPLQRAVELDSKLALAWNALGATLTHLKEYDAALEHVKRAIAVHPSELMFYRNLKMIYERMGKPDRFENEYRYHLKSGHTEVAKQYGLILAQSLRQASFRDYSAGNKEEATQRTREMLQVYMEINHITGVVAAHFSLGLLLEETGDREGARSQYREVLKINPNHLQARDRIRDLEDKND